MGEYLLFLKDVDDDLDPLRSFGMFAPGFVVEHSRVVDNTCFEHFHV